MIRKIGQAFVLDTAHTTYAFSILPGGHPEHLYYGRTIHIEHPDDLEILVEKHVFAPGNVNICEKEHAGFSLEDVRPVSYTHLHSAVPMILSVIGTVGTRILWIFGFFPHHKSLYFLFISYPASWIITIVMQVICFYFVRKTVRRELMRG